MQSVIHKRDTSRLRSHPIGQSNTAEVTSGAPGRNRACTAPGRLPIAKPLNWPSAEHGWNPNVESG
jgi:hypothetical protein